MPYPRSRSLPRYGTRTPTTCGDFPYPLVQTESLASFPFELVLPEPRFYSTTSNHVFINTLPLHSRHYQTGISSRRGRGQSPDRERQGTSKSSSSSTSSIVAPPDSSSFKAPSWKQDSKSIRRKPKRAILRMGDADKKGMEPLPENSWAQLGLCRKRWRKRQGTVLPMRNLDKLRANVQDLKENVQLDIDVDVEIQGDGELVYNLPSVDEQDSTLRRTPSREALAIKITETSPKAPTEEPPLPGAWVLHLGSPKPEDDKEIVQVKSPFEKDDGELSAVIKESDALDPTNVQKTIISGNVPPTPVTPSTKDHQHVTDPPPTASPNPAPLQNFQNTPCAGTWNWSNPTQAASNAAGFWIRTDDHAALFGNNESFQQPQEGVPHGQTQTVPTPPTTSTPMETSQCPVSDPALLSSSLPQQDSLDPYAWTLSPEEMQSLMMASGLGISTDAVNRSGDSGAGLSSSEANNSNQIDGAGQTDGRGNQMFGLVPSTLPLGDQPTNYSLFSRTSQPISNVSHQTDGLSSFLPQTLPSLGHEGENGSRATPTVGMQQMLFEPQYYQSQSLNFTFNQWAQPTTTAQPSSQAPSTWTSLTLTPLPASTDKSWQRDWELAKVVGDVTGAQGQANGVAPSSSSLKSPGLSTSLLSTPPTLTEAHGRGAEQDEKPELVTAPREHPSPNEFPSRNVNAPAHVQNAPQPGPSPPSPRVCPKYNRHKLHVDQPRRFSTLRSTLDYNEYYRPPSYGDSSGLDVTAFQFASVADDPFANSLLSDLEQLDRFEYAPPSPPSSASNAKLRKRFLWKPRPVGRFRSASRKGDLRKEIAKALRAWFGISSKCALVDCCRNDFNLAQAKKELAELTTEELVPDSTPYTGDKKTLLQTGASTTIIKEEDADKSYSTGHFMMGKEKPVDSDAEEYLANILLDMATRATEEDDQDSKKIKVESQTVVIKNEPVQTPTPAPSPVLAVNGIQPDDKIPMEVPEPRDCDSECDCSPPRKRKISQCLGHGCEEWVGGWPEQNPSAVLDKRRKLSSEEVGELSPRWMDFDTGFRHDHSTRSAFDHLQSRRRGLYHKLQDRLVEHEQHRSQTTNDRRRSKLDAKSVRLRRQKDELGKLWNRSNREDDF